MITAKPDPKDPSNLSLQYELQSPWWNKINDVLGGTERMRGVGAQHLPQHPEESDNAWANRLAVNTLFNQTELTLAAWVGRPFSEPVKRVDIHSQLEPFLDDIDLEGNNVSVFARKWFQGGVAKGLHHVLIDFPVVGEKKDGLPRTLEDDQKENLRPYWVDVPAENLISANAVRIQGKWVLTEIRILETIEEKNGFLTTFKERIRVQTPGHIQLWELVPKTKRSRKKEWRVIDEFDIGLDFIPLVTFYTDEQGFMLAKPPLLDLVNLNIRHWQSTSDQTAILTVARFPIMAASGALNEDNIVIGPGHWLHSPDPTGKFYYVEHEGKAIEAGRMDLADLEEQMAQYGAEFLKRKPGNLTATARTLDSAESTSPLQDMTIRFNDAMETALRYTAAWLKLEDAEIGMLAIITDFGPEKFEKVDLDALLAAVKSKAISKKAFVQELIRRGVLGEDFDPEADIKLIEEEIKKAAKQEPNFNPPGGPQPPQPGEFPPKPPGGEE